MIAVGRSHRISKINTSSSLELRLDIAILTRKVRSVIARLMDVNWPRAEEHERIMRTLRRSRGSNKEVQSIWPKLSSDDL